MRKRTNSGLSSSAYSNIFGDAADLNLVCCLFQINSKKVVVPLKHLFNYEWCTHIIAARTVIFKLTLHKVHLILKPYNFTNLKAKTFHSTTICKYIQCRVSKICDLDGDGSLHLSSMRLEHRLHSAGLHSDSNPGESITAL